MSAKRPFVSRLVAAATAVASVGAASCASNGVPQPWACGVAGQLAGAGAGAGLGVELASDDKEVGAAVAAGIGGAVVLGIVAWQACEYAHNVVDERERERRARLAKIREAEEARKAAEQARLDEEERRRREAEEARLRAEEERRRAAAAAAVLNESEAPELVLSGASFSTGSAALSTGAQAELGEVAATLRDFPELRVRIIGHTDSLGSSETNRLLSQRRAESVRDYLVLQGISSGRLEATGRGEDEPIASNDDAQGRATNRRVELDLIQ